MKNIITGYIQEIYRNRVLKTAAITISLLSFILVWATLADLKPIPRRLIPDTSDISRMRILEHSFDQGYASC